MPAASTIAAPPTKVAVSTELVVERVAIGALDALAAEWRELQARADHSFFVSWTWIGAWLAALPDAVPRSLLRVRARGRTIALAVVCERTVTRGRVIRSRGLFVNCTGDPVLDELTIEYNDFLIERGLERAARQAMLQCLLRDRRWDELFLHGWRDEGAGLAEAGERAGLALVTHQVRACHRVELDRIAAAGGDYVAALSSTVRYKVRRSLREAERLGEIRIDAAASPTEAARYLAELKVLHQRSWTNRGEAGAFANAFFDRFHAGLVGSAEHAGAVQLLRVSAGGMPVGYLYNFVHAAQVYNYQSGFDFERESSAQWRPGLVSHVRCIEFNQAAGMRGYDFLAGDQAYKRELGNGSKRLIWASMQRPRWRFAVERRLRALRDAFAGLRVALSRRGDVSRCPTTARDIQP